MKKVFEFEQDDEFGNTILVADIIQSWINDKLTKRAEVKVTELPPKDLEEGIKNMEATAPQPTEIKPPNFCYAPMSVEYCECISSLCDIDRDSGHCSQCGKVPKSKSPIGKLPLKGDGNLLPVKINEIIEYLNKEA